MNSRSYYVYLPTLLSLRLKLGDLHIHRVATDCHGNKSAIKLSLTRDVQIFVFPKTPQQIHNVYGSSREQTVKPIATILFQVSFALYNINIAS
jgi:hypothetical protein